MGIVRAFVKAFTRCSASGARSTTEEDGIKRWVKSKSKTDLNQRVENVMCLYLQISELV
jgi:hypothetical protein